MGNSNIDQKDKTNHVIINEKEQIALQELITIISMNLSKMRMQGYIQHDPQLYDTCCTLLDNLSGITRQLPWFNRPKNN